MRIPKNYLVNLDDEARRYYFEEMAKGNKEAREILILSGINYVFYLLERINFDKQDYDDLVSIGFIGLIKSIDTFDVTKGISFQKYADKCINNEIFMYFRKKRLPSMSLEEIICRDVLDDALIDYDIDIASDYENKEEYTIIRELVSYLPFKERRIIELYYGLDGESPKEQREIASIMGMSQSGISRAYYRALNELREMISDDSKRLSFNIQPQEVPHLL